MGGELVEPGFRAFVARAYGDEGRAWIARLPSVLGELSERWGLTLGPELTGGLLACVRSARDAHGRELVLKVGAGPTTDDEITALTAWAGRGAPGLIAADRTLGALVLERIAPGTHPEDAGADAVAGLLELLHIAPPAALPPLGEIVRRRLDQATRDGRATAQKAAWALAALAELETDPSGPVLLHGDLDERNLLRCDRRGLCAIDPNPCAGDPAYDAATWVHGNRRRGRRARLQAIVAATGLDRARVRDWAAIVGVHG